MKTGHKDVLQSELREAAARRGKCSCQDLEAWIEQRKKAQEWRKDRQREDRGGMSLKRQESIMKSKEQSEEPTVDWKITPCPFLGDRRRGQRKDCAVQGRGKLQGEMSVIIHLHPDPVCLPSCHNHCLMERLPLKGAGVVGTSSRVKELALSLAASHLSSHPAGAQWLPSWGLHPGLLPGDHS